MKHSFRNSEQHQQIISNWPVRVSSRGFLQQSPPSSLKRLKLKVLPWPSQAPDLNISGNLEAVLRRAETARKHTEGWKTGKSLKEELKDFRLLQKPAVTQRGPNQAEAQTSPWYCFRQKGNVVCCSVFWSSVHLPLAEILTREAQTSAGYCLICSNVLIPLLFRFLCYLIVKKFNSNTNFNLEFCGNVNKNKKQENHMFIHIFTRDLIIFCGNRDDYMIYNSS